MTSAARGRLRRWTEGLAVARRFLPELRQHRGRLLAAGGLSILVTALEVLRPWPIKWIFDGALAPVEETDRSFTSVVLIGVLAAVLIAASRALLQYHREVGLAQVAHQFTRGLRYRIFAHLTELSPLFHAKHKSGDLLVRLMGDVPMVSTMMVESSVEIATRGLLVCTIAAVMLFLDPVLSLLVFVVAPVLGFFVHWIAGQIRIAVRKQRRKEGDLADYLHEAVASTQAIQSLGGSAHVVRRFARGNRRSARAGLKAKKLAARLSSSVEGVLGVALAAVLCMGSFRVASGHLTPGELLVFLSYVRSLMKPLRSGSKHAERIAKGSACGERILTILDAQDRVRSKPGAPPAPERPRVLSFEDVVFRYDGRHAALSGLSADFQRGELAAVVGPNGAGKSTAAALALRLFDPESGRVCLDGMPLPDLDLDSTRERIGLCLQRALFFGDTLRENLLLGRPDAAEEELWAALEAAGAADLVRSLPEELDTRLGSNGVGLSGGQATRLSLARTLLRDTPVLILDEPFAGVDAEGIRAMTDTLRRVADERIVVVISHDLGRAELFDHVVSLSGGRAVGGDGRGGGETNLRQRGPRDGIVLAGDRRRT